MNRAVDIIQSEALPWKRLVDLGYVASRRRLYLNGLGAKHGFWRVVAGFCAALPRKDPGMAVDAIGRWLP